jgi:hypothetical protein
MKKTLSTLVILLSVILAASAQIKTVKLSSIYAGPVWGGYCEATNLDNNASTQYVYLSFYENHNGENPSVSIYLNTQADLDAFIKDMQSALDAMGSNSTTTWTRTEYAISTSSNSSIIYLMQKPTDGTYYTIMKKGQVKKLISKLKVIHLK